MNLILMHEDVTNSPKDWEDFWNSYDEWSFDDLEKIWNEMEKIEPLTTKKHMQNNYGTFTISRSITQRSRTITS